MEFDFARELTRLSVNEDNAEEFSCPICLEAYIASIWQCNNGHLVCDACIKSITVCPQCRWPYNGAPIRNRALESILDRVRFDCTHRSRGCIQRLRRTELSGHKEICEYRDFDVNLCAMLGFGDCQPLNTQKSQNALAHFIGSHQAKIVDNSGQLDLTINCDIDQPGTSVFNPVVIQPEGIALLLSTRVNEEQIRFSTSVVKFKDNFSVLNAPIWMEFIIFPINESSTKPSMKWLVEAAAFAEYAQAITQHVKILEKKHISKHYMALSQVKVSCKLVRIRTPCLVKIGEVQQLVLDNIGHQVAQNEFSSTMTLGLASRANTDRQRGNRGGRREARRGQREVRGGQGGARGGQGGARGGHGGARGGQGGARGGRRRTREEHVGYGYESSNTWGGSPDWVGTSYLESSNWDSSNWGSWGGNYEDVETYNDGWERDNEGGWVFGNQDN